MPSQSCWSIPSRGGYSRCAASAPLGCSPPQCTHALPSTTSCPTSICRARAAAIASQARFDTGAPGARQWTRRGPLARAGCIRVRARTWRSPRCSSTPLPPSRRPVRSGCFQSDRRASARFSPRSRWRASSQICRHGTEKTDLGFGCDLANMPCTDKTFTTKSFAPSTVQPGWVAFMDRPGKPGCAPRASRLEPRGQGQQTGSMRRSRLWAPPRRRDRQCIGDAGSTHLL